MHSAAELANNRAPSCSALHSNSMIQRLCNSISRTHHSKPTIFKAIQLMGRNLEMDGDHDSDEELLVLGSSSSQTIQTQEARAAFGDLAAPYGESRRRLAIIGLVTLVIFSVVGMYAIDLTRTSSAYQYASAFQQMSATSETCDHALGQRRLWFGNIISSNALCVKHKPREERLDDEDPFPHEDFSFLVIGDWGRDGMCCQNDVALEMSFVAKYTQPKFIASVGDNFYETGIALLNDPQVDRSWRGVYTNPFDSLRVPWHIIPGNHDHKGNAFAQIELSETDELWHMPHSFYFDTYANNKLFVAFLDTTCMYYSPAELRTYPNRTGLSPDYCDEQTERLEQELEHANADWKLVLGHHPFYSSSDDARKEQEEQRRLRDRLRPICIKHKVSAYISGHEHLLEHYVDDGFHSFVSGAGSKVRDVSIREPRSVFSVGTHGFLQVALRNGSTVLHFRFFDLKGAVLHSVFIQRPS